MGLLAVFHVNVAVILELQVEQRLSGLKSDEPEGV